MNLGKIDEQSMISPRPLLFIENPYQIPDTDGRMDSLTKQKNVSIFLQKTRSNINIYQSAARYQYAMPVTKH